jgi:hypothetical protein
MIDVKPRVLPVWWPDLRDSPANDPIGCLVRVEEMLEYLRLLPSQVRSRDEGFLQMLRPRDLEFLQKGKIEKSSFWLWAFFGDGGRRWNLCVFTGPDPFGGPTMKTWMCADNNAYDLHDLT